MMRFGALRDFIRYALDDPGLVIEPGPVLPEFPGRCVVLSRISSPGLDTDGLIDTVGWQIRSIGEQNSYDSAESLADDIDAAVQSLGNTQTIQGLRLVTGYRTGGPPTPLLVDDAQRHHFVCSYLFGVYSAVAAP